MLETNYGTSFGAVFSRHFCKTGGNFLGSIKFSQSANGYIDRYPGMPTTGFPGESYTNEMTILIKIYKE